VGARGPRAGTPGAKVKSGEGGEGVPHLWDHSEEHVMLTAIIFFVVGLALGLLSLRLLGRWERGGTPDRAPDEGFRHQS